MAGSTMHIQTGEIGDALHEMLLDDLAELVPVGEESRMPLGDLRNEVAARHAAAKETSRGPNRKWVMTPEHEATIRAQWNGTTRRMREIGEQIGVPWYMVRDWGQDTLHLPNPSSWQPNGAGGITTARPEKLVKPKAAKKAAKAEKQSAAPQPTIQSKPQVPWSTPPDNDNEIDAQREKRNALLASVTAGDPVSSDSAPMEKGWMTPKWVYSPKMGALISSQWDGTDASLERLAVRESMPFGILKTWVKEQHLTPNAPAPVVQPVVQPAVAPATMAPMAIPAPATRQQHDNSFTGWLDRPSRSEVSVFVVRGACDLVVLEAADGYRVLTPRGDWPDEPISRKLVERIVRLLSGGTSAAAVYGEVYQAEGQAGA